MALAPHEARRAMMDFFRQCVRDGRTEVFDDLRQWGLADAVLALLFVNPAAADDALRAALKSRGTDVQVPAQVVQMMDAARVVLTTDLDSRLEAAVTYAVGQGTQADVQAADGMHRAVMHLLVGFMGMGVTKQDVQAAGAALGILPPHAGVSSAGPQHGSQAGPTAASQAGPQPASQAGPQPASQAKSKTRLKGKARTQARAKAKAADGKTEAGAPGQSQEPRQGPGQGPGQGPEAAVVPAAVKTLAEAFLHAAHRGKLQETWPGWMRAGVCGMTPSEARALFFCTTRYGKDTGATYWVRVFGEACVDARTVLDVLRVLDARGVPLFAPLESGVRLTALAEKAAETRETFRLVVDWLRAARSHSDAAETRTCNAAYPLATTDAVFLPVSTTARARHAAVGRGAACVVCGRTAAEVPRTRTAAEVPRTRTAAEVPRTSTADEVPRTTVLRSCARCAAATYCSPTCQKWHWRRIHSHECVPRDAPEKPKGVDEKPRDVDEKPKDVDDKPKDAPKKPKDAPGK